MAKEEGSRKIFESLEVWAQAYCTYEQFVSFKSKGMTDYDGERMRVHEWSKFKKWMTWNKHSRLLIYTSNRVLEPAQAGKHPIQRGMQDDNNSSSWAFWRARVLLLRAYLLGLLLCIILLPKILWKRKIVSIMISCKTVAK